MAYSNHFDYKGHVVYITGLGLSPVYRHPIGYRVEFDGREVTSCPEGFSTAGRAAELAKAWVDRHESNMEGPPEFHKLLRDRYSTFDVATSYNPVRKGSSYFQVPVWEEPPLRFVGADVARPQYGGTSRFLTYQVVPDGDAYRWVIA